MSTVASRIDRPKTSPTYPNGPERAARGPSDAALVPAAADDARRVTGMQALDPRRHQDSRRRAGSKPATSSGPTRSSTPADRGPRRRPRPRAHAVGAVVFLGHRNVYWVREGRRTNRHRSRSGSHAATDRPELEDDRGVGLAWPAWPPGRRLGPLRHHSIVEASLARLQVSHRGRQGGRPRTCRVSLTPPCGRGLLRRGRRGVEPGAGTFDPRRTLPRRGLQPSWNRMRTGKPQREETPWRTDGAG